MILTVTANPTIDKVYFVDELKLGGVHRPTKITTTAGGKGINVSRVAALLGEKTMALGFSGGKNGAFINGELKKLGIIDRFTEVCGETRVNTNISDKFGNSTEILEAGPVITEQEITALISEFESAIDESDIICVAGSLPQGTDSSLYKEFISIAKSKNKKIIVDTSGAALKEIIECSPFMVKPNRDEIKTLFGIKVEDENDIKKALIMLHEKGIELPIITLGGDGALAYIDNKFYRFTSPAVSVKNAVGSGDSTVAGIAVGISRGFSFIDAVKLGMAAGTANTQFDETGYVSKELVDKYLAEIKYEII